MTQTKTPCESGTPARSPPAVEAWPILKKLDAYLREQSAAAHRTAILCSLVQTCKHLQLDPFVYLRDVIARVSTHPARRVLELTPREWKRLGAGLRRTSRRLNGSLREGGIAAGPIP